MCAPSRLLAPGEGFAEPAEQSAAGVGRADLGHVAAAASLELAQQFGIRLYLNLATDRTFLFRNGEVNAQTRVGADELEFTEMAGPKFAAKRRETGTCRAR